MAVAKKVSPGTGKVAAAPAKAKVQKQIFVDIESVIVDTSLQCRATVDPHVVEDYKEAYISDADMPPIKCVVVDGDLYLVDGFTRYDAQLQLKRPRVEVIASPGTMSDAVREACVANSIHGQRRTTGDIQRAISLASKHFKDRTVADLAKMVGVSVRTWHRYSEAPKRGNYNKSGAAAPKGAAPAGDAKPSVPAATKVKPAAEVSANRGNIADAKSLDMKEGEPCSACGETSYVLTDAGYACGNCTLMEGDKVSIESAAAVKDIAAAPKVPAGTITPPGPDPVKEIIAAFGRLVRLIDNFGKLPELETDLNVLSSKLGKLKK